MGYCMHDFTFGLNVMCVCYSTTQPFVMSLVLVYHQRPLFAVFIGHHRHCYLIGCAQ
jgi:hypothetical protein